MSDSYQAIYDAVRSRIHGGNISEAVERAASQALDTGMLIPRAHEAITILTNAYDRPSAVYRPRLFLDGAAYCALYGENLMDGCAGFGDTAEAAMVDFDRNWLQQKAPPRAQSAEPSRGGTQNKEERMT